MTHRLRGDGVALVIDEGNGIFCGVFGINGFNGHIRFHFGKGNFLSGSYVRPTDENLSVHLGSFGSGDRRAFHYGFASEGVSCKIDETDFNGLRPFGNDKHGKDNRFLLIVNRYALFAGGLQGGSSFGGEHSGRGGDFLGLTLGIDNEKTDVGDIEFPLFGDFRHATFHDLKLCDVEFVAAGGQSKDGQYRYREKKRNKSDFKPEKFGFTHLTKPPHFCMVKP